MSLSESQLVKAILEYLKLRGVLAWRNNTTGIWSPKLKVWKKPGGSGQKGISDILGVLPHGRLLAIECKVGRGKPTIEQLLFMAAVNTHGGHAFVCRSVDDCHVELDILYPKH